MKEEYLNLQKPKSSKIFGILKMGANNTDQVLIKVLQKQGYNEHEIQSEAGVHFSVVRSFMKHYDPSFEPCDPLPTADTQHLHDKIAEQQAVIDKMEADKTADDDHDADGPDSKVDESEEY